MARFFTLFSGSSGNSTYFGTAEEGVLIDAGMSAKQLTLELNAHQVEPSSLRALFITHEHIDHIKGLRVFASKYDIPIYATPGTLAYLERNGHLDRVARYAPMPDAGVALDTMSVSCFPTSHDAAQSVGYRVSFADGRVAAVATDTGVVTPDVLAGVRGADLVLLESNHDVRMLRCGPYPEPLKRRILSRLGHLSNTDCSAVVCDLLEKGTTRFYLGHLSRTNNTPEAAFAASFDALTAAGAQRDLDYTLSVAPVRGGELTIF